MVCDPRRLACDFIYKYRKIESAGTPVIHAKLGEILKYLILFPLTFLSGVIFEALGSGDAWLFFGFFFGAFLGFIFINLFLYRNPSKMFYGAKWLALFLVAFVLFFVVFGYNLLHHDRFVPDEDNVSVASVSIEGVEYKFRDREVVFAVVEYADDMIEQATGGNSFSGFVDIELKTKLGFAYSKRVPICDFERTDEIYGILRRSDEYLSLHEKMANTVFESYSTIWLNIPIVGDFCYSFSIKPEILKDAYLADIKDRDRYETPLLCTSYYSRSYLEIFEGDERTLDVIAQYIGFANGREMLTAFDEYVKNNLHSITVSVSNKGAYLEDYYKELEKADYNGGYWQNTDKFVKVYEGEQAYEIYRALRVHSYASNGYVYSCSDMTYDVSVDYVVTKQSYNEYVEKYPVNLNVEINYPSYQEDGVYSFYSVFSKDKIPSFVTTDFYSFAP